MGRFGMGKKPSTFGLDIGSSSVKVIELTEGKEGWGLTAFAQVPLPHDVISEGSIKEPGLVSDAVRECVQKAGIKATAAVISVSGREAIMKRVPLPKVTAKELADAISLEAEHHIPFAVDDVFLDYQVVGESSNSMSVVLVAVKKAEAAKQGQDVGVSWDDLVPALEAVSRDLSLEVQRTFDYFASTAESERIGRIVLSGGCAKLAGIEDFLASSWGVPVELARPFSAIDCEAAQLSDAELHDLGPVFAVALGLGLRTPGDKST